MATIEELETQARIGVDWPEVLGNFDCDAGRAEIKRIAVIDDARERATAIEAAIDVAMRGEPFSDLDAGSSEWSRVREALRDSLLAEAESAS